MPRRLIKGMVVVTVALLLATTLAFAPAAQGFAAAALPFAEAAMVVFAAYHLLKLVGFRWRLPKSSDHD
jgi:hypothetical protein